MVMKRMTILRMMILFAVCGLTIIACSKGSSGSSSGTGNNGGGSGADTASECGGTTKSYASDVSPIIQTNCATNSGCHGSGSSNGPGPLLTYTEVFNNRTAIRSAIASGIMPKNGTLSTTQKNIIFCWIDSGASNN